VQEAHEVTGGEGEARRIIVGVTGATGVVYGIRLIQALREGGAEVHLILSRAVRSIIPLETDFTAEDVEALADAVYAPEDLAARISSGSFRTDGMVVAPCSIKTLSAIANCYNDNLIVRAADVTLKERRRLVLMVRETPLHAGHLKLMATAAESGAIILPPVPAFYHHPETIQDIVDQSVGKALDLFDIGHNLYRRWKGTGPDTADAGSGKG
jgi:4-hydroxy-3-polyprenylbenzoate decarboxylase